MSARGDPGQLFAGLMSGTSLDGVDAVLVDLADKPRLISAHHLAFPTPLRESLLALHESGHNEIDRAARLANELSELYAVAVARLIEHSVIEHSVAGASNAVAAIGCHGQTVRHRPEKGYTVQLVNPSLLAERTGITVVADFRGRDVAAGGEGAPLVPAFHAHCFRDDRRHRVIVNIGGIANVTDLPPEGAVRGFDTGPGNMLLDAWARSHLGRDYDRDGDFAAGGIVQEALLSRMLADEFFRRAPPRSTGRDHFGAEWLRGFGIDAVAPADVQATLAELTARSIAGAIGEHCESATEVYLCGGGVHNRDLVSRLVRSLGGRRVESTEALGIHPDRVEATAFAWLAQRALRGEPGNLPSVTGARGLRVLGAIYHR